MCLIQRQFNQGYHLFEQSLRPEPQLSIFQPPAPSSVPVQDDMTAYFVIRLRQMPKDEISLGEKDPLLFRLPHIRNVHLFFYKTYEWDNNDDDDDDDDDSSTGNSRKPLDAEIGANQHLKRLFKLTSTQCSAECALRRDSQTTSEPQNTRSALRAQYAVDRLRHIEREV